MHRAEVDVVVHGGLAATEQGEIDWFGRDRCCFDIEVEFLLRAIAPAHQGQGAS